MFKEKVKELMNQQNITQKELAELSGITEASVSRYLSGERTPRIDIVINSFTFSFIFLPHIIRQIKVYLKNGTSIDKY